MPSLTDLLDPATTAVVTVEMQRGVSATALLTPLSPLSEVVERKQIVPTTVRLLAATRASGIRVVHATISLRSDRAELIMNNRMRAISVKNPDQVLEGSESAQLLPELGPEPAVLATDAIAGVPEEYADAVVGNTLALLANLATVDQILEVWSADRSASAVAG